MKLSALTSKYRSVPTPVKAAFWFTACQIIQNGCSFLALPILVRLLTPAQYGIKSVFNSWLSIIGLFATLSLNAGVYNNAMFKYPDRRDSYTSASQSLSAVLTLFCFAIYLLFHSFWDGLFGLSPEFTVAIFVHLLFSQSCALWAARQRYEYRYVGLLIYTALFAVFSMFVPIVAALVFPQEYRLKAVIYSGVLVQVIFGFAFMVYNYIKGKTFANRTFWKFALSFNIPLIPHYLSGIILGQADRVMIQRYIGDAQAGIYSFTYNISLAINIITTSINNAIIPYTYGKIRDRDYQNLSKIVNFLLLMIGSLVMLFSAIAPELIRIFATEDYYDAIRLVPVISLSSYFTFLYCLFANVEFFFEANKFITVASVIGAAANVLLNALLMPVFGYYAAGYTTLFCYILFSAAHYVFMRVVCRKRLGGDRVYNGRTILLLSVMFVAVAFGMMAIYDFPFIRYALILAAFIIGWIYRKKILAYFAMIKNKK